MNDQNMTREELLEALAKTQAQVNILQKALLEDSKLATQTQYEDIIQGFTDLVTRWLPDTTVNYVNDRYCEYFGLSMDHVVGNPFLPNLPEETQEIVKGAVRKLMSGKAEFVTTEEKSFDSEGKLHWIQWTYSPIRDESGAIYQFQSVGRDITDLKKVRSELELANRVVAQSPIVLFQREIKDGRPGKIIFVSENVDQYGYTAEEITSGAVNFDKLVHPDDLMRVGKELIANIASGLDQFSHEYRMLTKDGDVAWANLQTTITRDENGNPISFQGTLLEETERKQAQLKLEAANKERQLGLAQTQSMFKMSQAMTLASGMDEILAAVSESVAPVNLHRSYLLQIATDTENKLESVRIAANWGTEGEENLFPVGTVFPAQLHDAFQMFLTPEPFLIGDMTSDERLDPATREVLTGNGMRSAVVLSLYDGKRLFGGILMESRDVFEFTGDEQGALGMIAAQLSAVVQNEMLLQATNERAKALATVAEVSTAVAEIQDPAMALKQVVNLTRDSFGYYHAHAYQLEGETLRLISGAGRIGDQMVAEERTIPFDAEQSLVARAARTKKGVIVNDVSADPNFLPHPLLPNTKAEMAVPMLVDDEVLGVLDIQASEAYRFTEDDAEVLTTLATQVSTALQNAQLYTEREDLLIETQNQYETSRKLSAATDLQDLLAIVAESNLALDADRAYLIDLNLDDNQEIVNVTIMATWGKPGETSMPVGTQIPADMYEAVKLWLTPDPWLVEDFDTDERFDEKTKLLFTSQKMRSAVVLPLRDKGAPFAGLLLESRIPHLFTERERKMLGVSLPQLSAIVQKNLQFDDVREAEERFRTLVDAVPDMIFRFDPEGKIVDYKGAEGGTYVPPEVFLNKKYDEVLPPHVAAMTKEALEKGRSEEKTQTFEYALPNETGGMDVFEARTISSETGEAVALIRNVTEERVASRALKDASMVVEQSSVVLFRRKVVDNIPAEVVYISENISQYGFSPEAFMNGQTNFEETVHPDDVQRLGKEMFGSISRGEDTFETEYRAVIADDSVVWFLFQSTIERDEHGEAVIQQGILSDITASKTALEETQRLYEASRNLNSAADMEEILVAVMNAVSTRQMDRGFIFQVNTDDENKVQTARILANWDAVDASKLLPVGTVLTPENFELVRTLWDDPEPMLVDDIATDERIDEKTRAFLLHQNMKSIITLPLLDGETPLAFVLLESPEQYHFTERDERLASVATLQLTSVIQSELLHETTARRAEELSTVAEVSTAVTEIQDPQELLQRVVDLTKERFGLYHAHIYLLNEAGDTLVLRAGAGLVGGQMVAEGRSIPLSAEKSLVARAARSRAGVTVNDVAADPNFLPHPLLPETHAEMAVPLLVGDQVLGVLDVQSEMIGRFTDEDIRVQTTLASQVAVALQNAEQYAELQRADEVIRQSPAILFRRRIVDNMLEKILYVSDNVERYGYTAEQFVSGEVPFEQSVHPDHLQRVGEILIGNLQNNIDEYNFEYQGIFPDGNMPWFSLQATIERDENGEAVLQIGTIVDITETKKAQLAVVENEERFRTLVDAVPDLIFRFDPEGKIVDYKGAEGGTYVPPEVFLNKKYDEVLPPHVAALTKEALEKGRGEEKSRLFEYELPGENDDMDIFEARTIVSETGEAVALIRNVTEQRKAEVEREVALLETQFLYDTSARLNQVHGFQEMLASVAEASQLADTDRAYMLGINLDEKQEVANVTILANWDREGSKQMMPVGSQFPSQFHDAIQMWMTPTLWIVEDIENDARLDETTRQLFLSQGMRSALVLPLLAEGVPIAGVLFESRNPHRVPEREQRILQLTATQMAAVVQNELLLQSTDERAKLLASVSEIATELSAMQGSQDDLVNLVVDRVKEKFGLYHVHVYFLDEETENGTLRLVAGAGEIGAQMVAEKRTIPYSAEKSLVAQVARNRSGVMVNDALKDPNFLAHPLLPDTKAELAVPMIIGNRVAGVLDVQADKAFVFTSGYVEILTTLASQVGASLQSAYQFTQVQQSEALVRDIINATPDWIFVKDLDHRYLMANEGYANSLHIAVEDFIGKNDLELGFPEELVKGDPERGIRGFWADDNQVIETGEALLIERDIVQVDGQERIYSTLKTPLTDTAGNVTSVLIFARDVTEREALLQEASSRAEQEAMINAISQKIQATTSVEDALQVAIRELGDSLGANKTSIRLGVDAAQRKSKK